jgi:hypothetical protein
MWKADVQWAAEQGRKVAERLERLLAGASEGPAGPYVPLASAFRLPMKNLELAWYEATRRFGPYNYHPDRCEDYNLESGGDTDLGQPLVAPFSGVVLSAHNWGGGTGRVVQILGVTETGSMIVWAGWHLHTMVVVAGDVVIIGQDIGTIGNADGRYLGAHLHNQICVVNEWGIPAPTTYPSDGRYDWRQPSQFFVENGVDPDLVRQCTEVDGV